jgi:DNA-binding NtrC family response regulator/tetratricopeptide (TPR) repeat protein
MTDRLDGYQDEYSADRQLPDEQRDELDWDRLEEIGDLHYQASAFSSALDYYQRLLGSKCSEGQSLPRRLEVLRKGVDAALNIGNLALAGSLLERAQRLLQAARALTPAERSRLRAPLLGRRASLALHRSEYDRALLAAKHAFTILAVTDEHREVANLQVTMGACHQRLGRLEKAEEFYGDALATFRRIGDELGTAALYNNLALLHKNACRWERALELMNRAVFLADKHGASHLLSRLHLNEGIILGKVHRLGEARTALEKSVRLARSLGDRARQAKACLAFGRLELQAGRLSHAEELLREGKLLAEQESFLRESTIADEYLGDVMLARGEIAQALYSYRLGLKKCREVGRVCDLEGELLRRLAEAERLRGDHRSAIEAARAALAACEQCGEQYEIGFCHRTLALTGAAEREWEAVDREFRYAIRTFRRQNLVQEWTQTVLDYHAARQDTAGTAELLRLRKHLLAVQEEAAPVLDERMLCNVLQALAVIQLRLGHHDDALLTVFELERSAAGLADEDLSQEVALLRGQVERGLVRGVQGADAHLLALSGIPDTVAGVDRSVPRNLSSVLKACMEKVGADSGFIAMRGSAGGAVRIAARESLTGNLATQLVGWYERQGDSGDPGATCLFSRLTAQAPLLREVPALRGQARSCVFMPIALEATRFGLLFLGKATASTPQEGFGRTAIDFLATYLGFLALFLHEKARRAPRDNGHIPTPLEGVESFENVITQNEAMLEVLALVRKVAPSDLTTLLHGETGTGKGLLAYAIHALSRRKERRFLTINCAAIPETLLESELFGHRKGSFTGAHTDKSGLLVEAEGGTVFLDEIGKMSLSMQGKLLHFLDTKIVRPVGSVHEQRVDVRIICASKTDLQELCRQGRFLEDLYYRLLDFPLQIPPLRARRDDIELLTAHFLERFAQELEIPLPTCTAAFMDALVQHDWPGNVRELEKCLKRAVVLAQGEGMLRPVHLPPEILGRAAFASDEPVPALRETLAAVECREIARALKTTRGNKSQAARLLGISYPNLLKKVRLYGLQQG